MTTVVLGWPIERTVSDLRVVRNETSDQLMEKLKTPGDPGLAEARKQQEAARHDFAVWHVWSLLLNMVTILLVTPAMALAAQLPPEQAVKAEEARKNQSNSSAD